MFWVVPHRVLCVFEKDLKPPPKPLSLLAQQINALMFNLVFMLAFS